MSKAGPPPWDHEPRLTVNVPAMVNNARLIRQIVTPDAPRPLVGITPAVKGDGYGHGETQATLAAFASGASRVWTEGLRSALSLAKLAGPGGRRIIAAAWANSPLLDDAAKAPIEFTVSTLESLELIRAAALRTGRQLPIHLEVNVGLAGRGCPPEEWPMLADQAVKAQRDWLVRIVGVCGHPDLVDQHTDHVAPIMAQFQDRVQRVTRAGIRPIRSLAHSGLLLDFPQTRLDMVRPGVAFYGVAPTSAGLPPGFEAAMTLEASVVEVLLPPPGSTAGYGASAVDGTQRLAEINLGTSHGIPLLAAPGGAEVLINGTRHPLAGITQMGRLLVDVNTAPVRKGDRVLVFGPGHEGEPTAGDWSRWCFGSQDHEWTSGMRIPRTYVGALPEPAEYRPLATVERSQFVRRGDSFTRLNAGLPQAMAQRAW